MNLSYIVVAVLISVGVIFSIYIFNSSLFIKQERSKIAFSLLVVMSMFLIILFFKNEYIRLVAVVVVMYTTGYMCLYGQKHLQEDRRHPSESDLKLSEALSVYLMDNDHVLNLTNQQRTWIENYINQFSEERQQHAYLVVSDILKKATSSKLDKWTKGFQFGTFKHWLNDKRDVDE